jgi:type I restriction enzyme S subunit
MRRYNQYKDSGVEWIGEIPKGWEVKRLKWVTEIENSGIWGEDEEFPNSISVPIPTTGQLSIEGEWYYDKMNLRHLSSEDWEKYKCIGGDIVVVKSSGSSTNIITGKCGFISKEDSEKFGFSNFLLRVRPNKMTPKLVYYFLSSNLTKQRIERMVSSTTYPNLKVDEYSNSELLIPPLSEQEEIVSYLDTKTSLIDTLIENTQKKIELLKEKRTSLISEVVTKGLNPNVEMKDSGVEWIGEIPKGWITSKLGYLFRVVSVKNQPQEINLSVYRDFGVIPRDSRDDNHNVISEDTSNYKLVEVGDFVMNKMKCWMGSLGLSEYRGIVSPSYTVMKLNSIQYPKYLHYLLRSNTYIPQYRRLSYGVREGQWDLRFEDFRELPCLLPPLSEQEEIVSYLDEQTQLIDKTISVEERRIELLKEYRQSLISEVVTGKRKVTKDE